MIYFFSLIAFIGGVILFLMVISKHKEEEQYYDKFYFIVSEHNKIDEYLSYKTRIKTAIKFVHDGLLSVMQNRLKGTNYHKLVVESGYFYDEKAILYYMWFIVTFVVFEIISLLLIVFFDLNYILFPINIVFFYIGSKIYLEMKAKKQLVDFRKNFIYFLDLTSTCIKTGMTFTASLDAVAPILSRFSELLGYRITNFSQDIKYSTIEIACAKFYEKTPLTEVNDFISTVKNSAQYGAGMYSSLQELSKEIRTFHFLETEEKIGKVNAKMGIPLILFIMFPVVVEIIAPGLLRAMQNMSMEMLVK